ncbi:MAG: nucleoside recognition protein [Limnochordia bacterium]|jgi:spore maturation protein SpmB|nr:nucleoside recognition protein [Limnochordia bacterium]
MLEVNRKMVWKGTKTGLQTTWELAKVVVPTAMVVAVFRASGTLDIITAFFAPYMGHFGLSGEAAVVLFSGYFVNLYAAAGSIMALNLTVREITICAVMLGFCHSLLVELPISQKAGSPLGYIFLIRLSCSLAVGWLLGVFLP